MLSISDSINRNLENLTSDNGENTKFPTVGLKSLLQNSDLLDLLLKPLSSEEPKQQQPTSIVKETTVNKEKSAIRFADLNIK